MDADRLDAVLRRAFDAPADQRRVVVREAVDLDDAGRWAELRGSGLTVEDVRRNLREAPADLDLVGRWNWWVGALELAHGGFDRFRVRRYRGD